MHSAFLALLTCGVLVASQNVDSLLGTQEPDSCCAEAAATLGPLPEGATEKELWLRRIHEQGRANAANPFLSGLAVEGWRRELAELDTGAPLTQRFGLHFGLAQGLMRLGELDESLEFFERCVKLCEEHPVEAKGWLPEALFRLAAAHFRVAEKQNCIADHNSDSCIFPLSERAVHRQKTGAAAACEVLERLLALPGSDLTVEAQWLLNISHMALGTWPDQVPEPHRIPRERFLPEVELGHFVDRAREVGLARHSHAGSVVLDDFTGDGRVDVLSCAFDTHQPLRLSRNDGGGSYTDVTQAAGLSHQLGGCNVLQADVDGDGLLDLLVLRGGGFFSAGEFPNSLLRQDRPGHFVDITRAAGLELAAPTRTAAFADLDRDGDLDLFIGYETEPGPGGLRYPSKLYENDGQGVFRDVTAGSGLKLEQRCTAALIADVDLDGWPDLFLGTQLDGTRLFMNQGASRKGPGVNRENIGVSRENEGASRTDPGASRENTDQFFLGLFRDETSARGLGAPKANGPACFFDSDNDGDLDLFVGYNHHYRPVRSVAAYYMRGEIGEDTQRLFENDGRGNFRDATQARGLRRGIMTTGLNCGDVDNDGNVDLYLATGAHDFAALFPNVLLLNRGQFLDATFSADVGHLQKSNGIALADLDDDGDLDIACQIGGYYPDDAFGDVLFENPGTSHHWLEISLRGVRDKRFGIGARVCARLEDKRGTREVWGVLGSGGSLGSGPLRVHLGLGDATAVRELEVHWPIGGLQVVRDVPLDQRIVLTQDREGFAHLAPTNPNDSDGRD